MKPYVLGTSFFLLASLSFSAAAQRAQTLPTQLNATPRWDIAIGTDLLSWGSGGFRNEVTGRSENVPELTGMGARRWLIGRQGLAFRAQVSAGTTLPDGIRATNRACGDVAGPGPSPSQNPLDQHNSCRVSLNHLFLGFSGSAIYEFRRNTRVRPYVTAGPGLYMTHLRRRQSGEISGSIPRVSSTDWTLGATAGLGVSIAVKGGMLFAEQSVLVPNIVGESPLARNKAPLFIGYRF